MGLKIGVNLISGGKGEIRLVVCDESGNQKGCGLIVTITKDGLHRTYGFISSCFKTDGNRIALDRE